MDDQIHVAITTDSHYCKQVAALLASLANAHVDDPVRVSLCYERLSDAQRDRLKACSGPGLELELVNMAQAVPASILKLPGEHPSQGSAPLLRLRLADFLPDATRVIYLDADTIALRSLRPLWETDLGTKGVGAVRDCGYPWFSTVLRWRQLGLPPDAPYFNSGVLVIPLGLWRQEAVADRVFNTLLQNRTRFGDQCGLNIVFHDRWKALPPLWNVQHGHLSSDWSIAWASEGFQRVDEARSAPAIVHFHRGPTNRPWLPGCTHDFAPRWFEFLDETPWRAWRPRNPTLAQRAMRRAKAQVKAFVMSRPW